MVESIDEVNADFDSTIAIAIKRERKIFLYREIKVLLRGAVVLVLCLKNLFAHLNCFAACFEEAAMPFRRL
jgi:hypothetical protein